MRKIKPGVFSDFVISWVSQNTILEFGPGLHDANDEDVGGWDGHNLLGFAWTLNKVVATMIETTTFTGQDSLLPHALVIVRWKS